MNSLVVNELEFVSVNDCGDEMDNVISYLAQHAHQEWLREQAVQPCVAEPVALLTW